MAHKIINKYTERTVLLKHLKI